MQLGALNKTDSFLLWHHADADADADARSM
jgi:hypothetical protein